MLPKILALLLMLISIAMFAPIGASVINIASGQPVPAFRWIVPIVILATGALLTSLLARKPASLNLYLAACALWVVTAGYFFMHFLRTT